MTTIRDVAREAGVSVATVSRVFNDSRLVTPETQRTVRDVASRLDYWPNGAARSLITNRTHTLGVLMPDIHGEFFSGIIRGLDLASRKEGFHLLVSSSHADGAELMSALRAMRGRVDGVVLMAPDVDAPATIKAYAGDVPIVLLDPRAEIEGFDSISIANFDGAYAVVRHLLALGHRRIATVTGPERNVDARQRLEGYRAALRDGGGERSRELEITGDFTEPSGREAGQTLLRLGRRPSAVFAGNDYMAVGVMRALSEAGARVPQDVAVAGFDDIEMARYLAPPLTTVRVDTLGLGTRAVHRLLRLLRGTASPRGHRHEVLPTTLAIRASCGAGTRGAPPVRRSRASERARAVGGTSYKRGKRTR